MTINEIAPYIGLTMLVIFGGILWFLAEKNKPGARKQSDKRLNK